MSKIIKNYSDLASTDLRKDALDISEAGLQAIDTEQVLLDAIKVSDGVITVMGESFTLNDYKNIYIVGFGKVSCTAAATLETLLQDKVKDGAVIGLKEKTCAVVDTYAGTHPMPSHYNYTATKHIMEIAQCATEQDLVLVIVSGGGSALLCSTMSECDQGKTLYESFLSAGGTIDELNVVRRHISTLKGGGLAKALYPATVVSLIFSDVPGGDVTTVASGPTFKDLTTVDDAKAIVDKYNLGSFQLVETPKSDECFEKVHNFTVVSNVIALEAMQNKAIELGYKSEIVSATQYATPEETQASLADKNTPNTMYCLGGETKLIIPANCIGKGGRNDYLALVMMDSLEDNQIFVSLASDGKDNTEAAGALVDQETKAKAKSAGLVKEEYTECLNSYPFFDELGDHIVTGILESNVSDLMFILTSSSEK